MENNFYTHITDYKVVIADINYGNHVGNAAFLNIIHQARLNFLQSLGDFSEINIGENTGLIMLNVTLNFKAQVFLNNELQITTWVSFIKNSSFGLEFEIINKSQNNILALSSICTMAAFNYTQNSLARLPQSFTHALNGKKV